MYGGLRRIGPHHTPHRRRRLRNKCAVVGLARARLFFSCWLGVEQGRPADKTQSMVKIKEEKIKRAKTYRRVAEEAKMLGDFIRLADYMLVEGVVARGIGAHLPDRAGVGRLARYRSLSTSATTHTLLRY